MADAAPPRREPPPWMRVVVQGTETVTARLTRISLAGEGLRTMATPDPAASIRLLIPSTTGDALVIPQWTGNEFLLADGVRPVIRTFTPLAHDPAAGTVDLEVISHPDGAVSNWSQAASPGDQAALSGPGRGYTVDPGAGHLLVFGDETAAPAVSQLIDAAVTTRPGIDLTIHMEIASPAATPPLAVRPGCTITWHLGDPDRAPLATLVDAATAVDSIHADTHVWAAGEAAAMQALRKHFQGSLGAPRAHTTIRGYWKQRS